MKRLSWLDELRGVAVSGVLLGHYIGASNLPRLAPLMAELFGGLIRGVQLFYLLSGIILTLLYKGRLSSNQQPDSRVSNVTAFYLKRFFRIFPLFALVSILFGGFISHSDKSNIAQQLTVFGMLLSPRAMSGIVGIEWSVAVECTFYLLFPTLITIRDRSLIILSVLGLAITAVLFKVLPNTIEFKTYIYLLPNTQLIFFVAGILIARHLEWFSQIKILRESRAIIAFSILGLMITPALVERSPIRFFMSLLWCPLLAVGFLGLMSTPTGVIRKLLHYLGARSYSVYLLHMIPLAIFRDGGKALSPFELLAAVSLTLIVSEFTFRMVENPGIALGSRIISRRFKPSES